MVQHGTSKTGRAESGSGSSDVPLVDPRTPRFGQSVTATAMLAGVLLREPAFVYAIAVVLAIPVLSNWRVDPYAVAWRRLLLPVVGEPAEREPAPPHRFAKLLGATGAVLASGSFAAGFPIAGYVIALVIGFAAGLAGVTGLCLGCRMYRQVSFLRRHGIV